MCRLNLYFIPKCVDRKAVFDLFGNVYGYKVPACIDDEEPLEELKENYGAYIDTEMRCDCDSIVGRFDGYGNSLPWDEFMRAHDRAEVERLEKIRDFMEGKTYKKEKKTFEKQHEKLLTALDDAIADVRDAEMRMTDEVMERTDITDDEKNRLLHEKVYPEMNRLSEEAEKRPARLAAMKAYQKFSEENQTMCDSWLYTLKRSKPKKTKMIPLDDFLSGNEASEEIEVEMPSNCIYDAIDAARSSSTKYLAEAEYKSLLAFIDAVLAKSGEIKLLTFWQDGLPVRIDKRREVKRADLKIDDIVFLGYHELLTVRA